MAKAQLVVAPPEVKARLRALGLARNELVQVAKAALWAYNSTSVWDPRSYRGWKTYATAVRRLRELLCQDRLGDEAWSIDDTGGFALTIDPAGKVAIAFSRGTPGTGDPNGWPRTKYRRGEHAYHGLHMNWRQLKMFESNDLGEPMLWFLLVDVREDEVFVELSLAVGRDASGRVSDWHERIIMGRYGLDQDGVDEEGEDGVDEGYEIDVVPR